MIPYRSPEAFSPPINRRADRSIFSLSPPTRSTRVFSPPTDDDDEEDDLPAGGEAPFSARDPSITEKPHEFSRPARADRVAAVFVPEWCTYRVAHQTVPRRGTRMEDFMGKIGERTASIYSYTVVLRLYGICSQPFFVLF